MVWCCNWCLLVVGVLVVFSWCSVVDGYGGFAGCPWFGLVCLCLLVGYWWVVVYSDLRLDLLGIGGVLLI